MRWSAVLLFVPAALVSALTWTSTGDLADARIVRDITVGPGGYLYAAASIDTRPATYSARVFYSTDFSTWLPESAMPGQVELITALCQSRDDTLFAATCATGSGNRGPWLYYSGDGLNWNYRSRVSPSGTGSYSTMTCLVQDSGGRLLAGTDYMAIHSTAEVFRSDDNGTSWLPSVTMPHIATHAFLFIAADNSAFLGTDWSPGQTLESTDRGVNWTTSLAGGYARSGMAQSATGKLFVGTRSGNSGTVDTSGNGGSTWAVSYSGNSTGSLCRASDGNLYAGTSPNGEVLVSTDDGASWSSAGLLSGVTDVYRLVDVDVVGTHWLYAATGPSGDVFRADLTPTAIHAAMPTAPGQTLTIKPNPTPRGMVKVRLNTSDAGPTTARILDVRGRVVRKLELDAEVRVDLSREPAGVYILEVSGGGLTATRRFVMVE